MTTRAAARRDRHLRPGLDRLEARASAATLGGDVAGFEQLVLELLNDARFLPVAYTRTLNSTYGFQPFRQKGLKPAQPLAVEARVARAARLHSEDMLRRRFFDHTTPDGVSLRARIRRAGFPARDASEAISSGDVQFGQLPAPDALRLHQLNALHVHLQGLINDAFNLDAKADPIGHRRLLLDLGGKFRDLRAAGVGIALDAGGMPARLTIDVAQPRGRRAAASLTGVAFDDANASGAYDPGEGLPGVSISVAGAGATTTLDGGGYGIPLRPGVYTVTAQGPGLPEPVTRTVAIGRDNARLNFTTVINGATLTTPVGSTLAQPLGTIGPTSRNPVPAPDGFPLPRTDPTPHSGRIDWGDGTASDAAIHPNGAGGYVVAGSHRYAHAGTFATRALVVRQDGGRDVLNGVVVVTA